MKKIYYLGPLVSFALFAAYAMNFNKSYDAHEAQKAVEEKVVKDAKLKVEAEARKKAIDEAMASQARLKNERLAREAEEMKKKDDRQASIDARNLSNREQEKLMRQIDRLKKEVKVEEDAIAKLDASITYNKAEKVFISQFTEKARVNLTHLTELLTKIEAVEIARNAPPVTPAKTES